MVESRNLIISSSLSCDQQFAVKISEMRRITTASWSWILDLPLLASLDKPILRIQPTIATQVDQTNLTDNELLSLSTRTCPGCSSACGWNMERKWTETISWILLKFIGVSYDSNPLKSRDFRRVCYVISLPLNRISCLYNNETIF